MQPVLKRVKKSLRRAERV